MIGGREHCKNDWMGNHLFTHPAYTFEIPLNPSFIRQHKQANWLKNPIFIFLVEQSIIIITFKLNIVFHWQSSACIIFAHTILTIPILEDGPYFISAVPIVGFVHLL